MVAGSVKADGSVFGFSKPATHLRFGCVYVAWVMSREAVTNHRYSMTSIIAIPKLALCILHVVLQPLQRLLLTALC